MALAFSLIFPCLLLVLFFALCYGICRIIGGLFKKKVRYRLFGKVTPIFCFITIFVILYGYSFGRFRYEVNEEEYCDQRVPESFDGYRIVHISDFHIGGFRESEAFVDTLVNAVNALHPDLICFTGDLVSINHTEVLPFIHSLQRLEARDGVVSVLGNHDYAVYDRSFLTTEQREQDRAKLISIERDSLDWKLLLNESFFIRHGEDSIAILGLENQSCGIHQKVRRGDLAQTMHGTEGSYQILLSHDPSQWDEEVLQQTDIELTLSGHTHAMQFKVLGWTPCRWFYKRADGLFTEGNQKIYVNIGLGELMPFRFGATPEVTLHVLKRP